MVGSPDRVVTSAYVRTATGPTGPGVAATGARMLRR